MKKFMEYVREHRKVYSFDQIADASGFEMLSSTEKKQIYEQEMANPEPDH